MRALCDFLQERFKSSINSKLPQEIVRRIKEDLDTKKYTAFVKLDVSNYYPSILHEELFSRIRKRINKRHTNIINLIKGAIETPTTSIPEENNDSPRKGVPQGLSISNVLADIYLSNIDKYFTSLESLSYYRYVDDILILCSKEDSHKISEDVIRRFKKIGLKIHDAQSGSAKYKIGRISENFDYLGYKFQCENISVRRESIDKLRGSLASIFTYYKYSKELKPKNNNADFLEWRLNLRIAGCVFQKKRKGWLHFFSEINDISLLHRLDHYVKLLMKRFDVHIEKKLFLRSFYEIQHRKFEYKYIPNFDQYSIDQMKEVLNKYFNTDVNNFSDEEIKQRFMRRIDRQVKDLLEDIGAFS